VSLGGAPRRFFEGERPPPEPFAEHVLALWTFDVGLPAGESALHTIWPDGCVSLSVVADRGAPVAASIIGPRMRPLHLPMRGGRVMRGIRLWPDTAAQVLAVPPLSIRDLMRPAAELLGMDALALARAVAAAPDDGSVDAVWESWLGPRIAAAALPEPDVRLVVRLLIDSDGTHDIAAAAERAECDLVGLDERFTVAVGLTPRQFARLRRVRAAIGAIMAGERSAARLAERAAREPSQFAREFSYVTGFEPEELMREVEEIEADDSRRDASAS
jgi:AraC-like DNA-binding protein